MNSDMYGGRRQHDRKIYRTEIVIIHLQRPYQGSLKDISVGGAYILTPAVNQFSVGDVITIDIPFTTGKKNIKRRARIKRQDNAGIAVEFF